MQTLVAKPAVNARDHIALGKTLRVLGHAERTKPLRDLLHALPPFADLSALTEVPDQHDREFNLASRDAGLHRPSRLFRRSIPNT
jgi:hypothetical protein